MHRFQILKGIEPPKFSIVPLKIQHGKIVRGGLVFTDPETLFVHKTKSNQKLWETVLIKYDTDILGTPKKPFNYQIMPWLFGERTFANFEILNTEFPFISHDIKFQCTDEKYQFFDLMPCAESIWQFKKSLREEVLKISLPIWDFINC